MVKNELTYYSLTLKSGQNAIQIEDKLIPILGIFVSKDSMYEILSGKKIEENLDNKIVDGLSYISIRELPSKEAKDTLKYISNLTVEEKTKFNEELSSMEKHIKDENYLNNSFGLGDRMTRRLVVNSNRKDLKRDIY